MAISGTETRPTRPLLLVALIVVSLLLVTVWFREGDNGPVHSTQRAFHAVVAPVSRAGEWATTPLRAVGSWFGGFGISRSEVAELRSQNAELRRRNAELQEARQENARLKQLLGFVQGKDLRTLGARVIGRPSNAWEGVITIDVGTADGVRPGMPVVTGRGLLGQTVEVAGSSSKVRLITDQRSGVASMLQRTRAEGITRGSIDGDLTLDFVSTAATVTAGDAVITSGMGGVFPKGLLVGEVIDAKADPGALYQDIRLRPAASLGDLEEVLVIVGQPPAPAVGGGE